jgi:hypothetical protein
LNGVIFLGILNKLVNCVDVKLKLDVGGKLFAENVVTDKEFCKE